MKILIIGLSLLSLGLYLIGYHSFWFYINGDPWLLDWLYKLFGNNAENQELIVTKANGPVWFEDKLSFYSFVLSIFASLLVIILGMTVKVISSDKQFKAISVSSACVILVMGIHFLFNNSLIV